MKDFTSGRPTRIALHEPLAHAPHAALMIDFDNVTMGIRSDLQAQLRKLLNSEIIKGKVAVQRAYADWRRYPQYIVPLSEASIDLIFAPAFGSNKKNATDIRLAIDALELVFTRPEIGTFILLSGDSDFSSLVLKLKEYGKYIIGVGLRESSSDLLIQNCDEYYSYAELTGLTREGEADVGRRDPWELVVEAVSEMKRENDVMRSDRLKQVMQTLDPNFDEKDAGFSRFSKFVVEAGHRGLLSIEKMDNGQHAVDVGENANIPPDEEAALRQAVPQEPAAKPRRRKPRRKEEDDAGDELTLSAAFDLLRRVLAGLDQGADGATAADVRERMVELHGDGSDPLFQSRRFQRMLRQAHDANVVEMAKVDGVYRLKSVEESESKADQQGEAAPPSTSGEKPSRKGDEDADDSSGKVKRASTRRSTRGRGRSSRKKADVKADSDGGKREEQPAASAKAASPNGDAPAESPKGGGTRARSASSSRNPRYRRGSRGGGAARSPSGSTDDATAGQGTPAKESASETKAASPPSNRKTTGTHSVGRRRGGRSHDAPARSEGDSADASPPAIPSAEPASPPSDAAAAEAPPSESKQPATEDGSRTSQQGSLFEGSSQDDGSLFRRMTAALQRVVRGPESE